MRRTVYTGIAKKEKYMFDSNNSINNNDINNNSISGNGMGYGAGAGYSTGVGYGTGAGADYSTGIGYGTGTGTGTDKPGGKKKKSSGKAGRFFKKVIAIVASAALFGGVAGGVMCGVYHLGIGNTAKESESQTSVDIPLVNDTISTVTPIISDSDLADASVMNVSAVAKSVMPAMVALKGTVTTTSSSYPFGGYGQSYEATTSGTGIIVGKNDTELLVLTNSHVVDDVNNLKCVFADEKEVSCVVKGSKSDKDIAVVAVALNDIPSDTMNSIAIAELGDSDGVVIGQQVVAIGNALGEGQSVTNGIISAVNRSITVNNVTFEGLIMTNAAINSGNSGGALLDASGKVIAINFAKTSEDGVEGMAYSIPVSNVRELINSLMNKETRKKVSDEEAGSLGINAVNITSSIANVYGFPTGVQIRTVVSGSAAEKAGLGKFDIIVGFDGQTVSSMSGLTTLLQYYKYGETVEIEYYRLDGNKYVLTTVNVTLDKKNK